MASHKYNPHSSGFVLILAIVMLGVLSTLGLVGISLISIDGQIAADSIRSAETFYLAEAGLKHVMCKLTKDHDFRETPVTVNGSLGDGTFSVTISKNGNIYNLLSTAIIGAISRSIYQSAETTPSPTGPFSNALYAYNYEISLDNTAGTINGDIVTCGEIINYDPDLLTVNGEVTSYAPSQEPYTVDYDGLRAKADHVITSGFTFTGGNTYGAPGNEEIWYIEGKVQIESNATIYGSIVCPDRNIVMDNTSGITIAPAAGEPALVTNNYINADYLNDSSISGLMYAGTEIQLSSCENVTINGALIAEDVLVCQDNTNLEINYDPVMLGDLSYFIGYEGQAIVVAQNDWNEI